MQLVYDRTHPHRVMLARDWPDASSTSALVKLWLVGIAMGAALVTLLSFGVAALRRNRPASLRTRPSPAP